MSSLHGVAASAAQSYLTGLGYERASADAQALSDEQLISRGRSGIDHIEPVHLLERVSADLPVLLDRAMHLDTAVRSSILAAVIENLTNPPPSRRPLDASAATYSWARHHWARGYVRGLSDAYQARLDAVAS